MVTNAPPPPSFPPPMPPPVGPPLLHGNDMPAWTPQAKPRGRFPIVLVVTLLVVGIAAGAFWFLGRDRGPSYPKQWDSRVAGLVPEVERLRGLTFEHPVTVNFYSTAEFKKRV